MRSRDYFLGKRIAVIGVGAGGEMLADIKSLVKANALVSVYDLRSEARLLEHAVALRSFGLANLVLGQIPPDDLLDMDLIVLSRDYPMDSTFLAGAKERGIDIRHPETLFLKLAPPVTVVGVIGDHGTSTVMSMLSPMLKAACQEAGKRAAGEKRSFVEADYESGSGILSGLKGLATGDIVLMRMPGAVASEIAALGWSPQIAVFASMLGPQSYAGSPFEIIADQTYNNYVVGSDELIDAVRASGLQTKAKLLRTKASIVPEDWIPGARRPHDREYAALALQAARALKTSDDAVREALSSWKPLKARLEPLKRVRGVDVVNDAASLTPASTALATALVSKEKNAIVIFGGADHGRDCRDLYAAIRKHARAAIVLPGSGTLKERRSIQGLDGVDVVSAPSLEEAVRLAFERAHKGNVVIYSPGFPPGGADASREERSERFLRALRSL